MKPTVRALPARVNLLLFEHKDLTDRLLEKFLDAVAESNTILFELGIAHGHPYTWDAIYKFDPKSPDGSPQEVWGNVLDIIAREGEDCDGWSAAMTGFWRSQGRNASPMIYQSGKETKHAVTWVSGPPPRYTHGPFGLAIRGVIEDGWMTDNLTGERVRMSSPSRRGFIEDPARAMGMMQVQEATANGQPAAAVYKRLLGELRGARSRFHTVSTDTTRRGA